MSAETNIALIQKVYSAFGKGDVPTILEFVAEDVDWGIESQASNEVPWHGTGKGKKFVAKFFETLGRECTFPRFEPSGFLASDTAVACLVTFEVVIKKNGRQAVEHAIHHFTLDHGRVTKWRGWEDTAFTKATWLG
jgi:ketosteroid isomerase-like protein